MRFIQPLSFIGACIVGATTFTLLPSKCSAGVGGVYVVSATRNQQSPNMEWDDVAWTDMPASKWTLKFACNDNANVPATPSGLTDCQVLTSGTGTAEDISASFHGKTLVDTYIQPAFVSQAPYAYHNIGIRSSDGMAINSYSSFLYYSWK